MSTMKLFIWNAPYIVQHGSTFAYAIAPDVDAARRAIRAGRVSRYGYDATDTVPQDIDIDREPDRVLEGPCGEVYEWSE